MSLVFAPLWNLFNAYRAGATLRPSVDSYIDFFEVIQESDNLRLESAEDLKELCKLFWVKDVNDAGVLDQAFESFYVQAVTSHEPEDATDGNTQQPTGIVQNEAATTIYNSEINAKRSSQAGDVLAEDMEDVLDFELVIADKAGRQSEEHWEVAVDETEFSLNDQAIMPFNSRFFAQRLRRRVETFTFETTSELDLPTMVERFCDNGFIENVIYNVTDSSSSNIVLLSDRFGSMFSYEYLEEHLKSSFRAIPSCAFESYFFYNIPQNVHLDRYRLFNERGIVEVSSVDHAWTENTWFFILSDAGAHSGVVNLERMRQTLKFWRFLHGISNKVFWFNPVPFQFLNDCTASRLQLSIPMFDPSHIGIVEFLKQSKNA